MQGCAVGSSQGKGLTTQSCVPQPNGALVHPPWRSLVFPSALGTSQCSFTFPHTLGGKLFTFLKGGSGLFTISGLRDTLEI